MEQPQIFGPRLLTVTELSQYLRALMESDEILRDLWVSGEISNLSQPASGHIYFTLKDPSSALRCVIWRTTAARLLVHLRNGQAVEAHGAISLYERDGQYQLYIDSLRLAGEGWLYQEFLRLKARLEADGLFDEARKRPVPAFPQRIGIVTSATGAALQDILNTLNHRYPLAEVILSPAPVQGDDAPPRLVRALQRLEAAGPDVILMVRGGGSLEDLWAFNDERVVRAIVACGVPVITGIGHETDFTLADFAADLRAPTPTGAAVLATPDAADLRAALGSKLLHLDSAVAALLASNRRDRTDLEMRLARLSPQRKVQEDRQRLDELTERALRGLAAGHRLRRARVDGLASRLQALSPLAVLQRGYAVVRGPDGRILQSVQQVKPGDAIAARLKDGELSAQVQQVTSIP
ncbi:MAG: exodeoxyribonuclease VII large subunit [Chloroflexi bacterium]|nr:MAG: exodeoxyribonuclease VII large subunit [Chloroflexota bacterium]